MSDITPIYQLPYLVGSDGGRQIKEVSEALALRLDAVLAQNGQPPLDADLTDLLARLTALEQGGSNDDTGWQDITNFGAGWANAPGYRSQVRAIGDIVSLRGAVQIANGGLALYSNMFTLPSGFSPAAAQFISNNHASRAGVQLSLAISTTGLVTAPTGYQTGATQQGDIFPLHSTWMKG